MASLHCLPVGGLVLRFHWSIFQAQLGLALKLFHVLVNPLWASVQPQIFNTRENSNLALDYVPEDCIVCSYCPCVSLVFQTISHRCCNQSTFPGQNKKLDLPWLGWGYKRSCSTLLLCLSLCPASLFHASSLLSLPPNSPLTSHPSSSYSLTFCHPPLCASVVGGKRQSGFLKLSQRVSH